MLSASSPWLPSWNPSPLYIFGTFVKNEVGIVVWIRICVFYSVPLVFMSAFVTVPCCFYCYCFVIYFEVRYCDSSSIALFAEYGLGYSRSLVFPNELLGRFFNLCFTGFRRELFLTKRFKVIAKVNNLTFFLPHFLFHLPFLFSVFHFRLCNFKML
jgi:hypothetical protein